MQTTLANAEFDYHASGLVDLDLGSPADGPGADPQPRAERCGAGSRQRRRPAARPRDGRGGRAARRRAGAVGLRRPRGRRRRRGARRAQQRRARQDRRPAADRHPALQHLSERSRRAVAAPDDRGRRVGDGAASPGRRSADRARPFARRQLGHGRLHRPVAPRAFARARARPHPGHRPRHRRRGAPVRQRRGRHSPPAASVRGRIPAPAVAGAARPPGRARAELGLAARSGDRRVGARRGQGQRIAGRAGDRDGAAALARRDGRRARCRERCARRAGRAWQRRWRGLACGQRDACDLAARRRRADACSRRRGCRYRRGRATPSLASAVGAAGCDPVGLVGRADASAHLGACRERSGGGRRDIFGRRARACGRGRPGLERFRQLGGRTRRAGRVDVRRARRLQCARRRRAQAARRGADRAGAACGGAGLDLRRRRRRDRRDRCRRSRAVPDLRGGSAGTAAQARRRSCATGCASPPIRRIRRRACARCTR